MSDDLAYTVRSNFPGYFGKAARLAIEHHVAMVQVSGLDPDPSGKDLTLETQAHLRLLCDLRRPESYDFAWRELQHNLNLTTEEMTWSRIYKACKIKPLPSGEVDKTLTRGKAMKICLEASLAVASDRCQHTFVDTQHSSQTYVVETTGGAKTAHREAVASTGMLLLGGLQITLLGLAAACVALSLGWL